MTTRGRPRNFNREDALRAAMHVFWDQGYDGTSMADLISAMHLNSPSIYAAFGSKEKLFLDAVALYRATEGGRIWREMMEAPTARMAIETMLRVSAEEFSQSSKPKGCLVILGAIHSDDKSRAVQRALQQNRTETVDLLTQRFKQAVMEGELQERPDWHRIATYFITVQQGMSIQARDGASRESLLAIAECAMAGWDGLVSATGVSE